jgi:hypothetical protein
MHFGSGETATRLRAALVLDGYSNEPTQRNWNDVTEVTIPGVAFNPGSSNEPSEVGRNAVITQPEVYAPFDADVLAGDRLVVRGDTYEVDGNPAAWRSPFTGWEPGLVIKLKTCPGSS